MYSVIVVDYLHLQEILLPHDNMTRSTSQVVGVFIILLGGESIKAVDLASLFETLTSLAPLLPLSLFHILGLGFVQL